MNHSDSTAVASQQEGRLRTTDNPPARGVDHPDWCDLARCTATPAAATGEAHQGIPRKVTIRSIYGELKITASLSQAHCRWPTDVYVDLDVCRLRHECQVAQGRAAFPVDKLAAIAAMLTDLAAAGQAWADQQVDQELTTIRRRIAAERPAIAERGASGDGEEAER